MVPGSTNCCISPVTKVSLVRFGTRKVRALPLPLSTMPKTHVPLEIRPRLYLRLWPNIDSSISIVFPRPPNLMLPCRIFSEQISLSFRSNATTVRSDTPDSRDTFLLDSSIDHRKMMYSHLASDTLESSKMDQPGSIAVFYSDELDIPSNTRLQNLHSLLKPCIDHIDIYA